MITEDHCMVCSIAIDLILRLLLTFAGLNVRSTAVSVTACMAMAS